MTYTLMIDEDQRVALLDLIKAAAPLEAPGADHPLAYWENMLVELPAHEAEAPGCLHGFCL